MVRLVHITTVPDSLEFLAGQVGYVKAHGFDVQAISSPGAALDLFAAQEGISAHALEMPRRITPLRDLAAVVRFWRLLRRLRPQIVHAHTPKGGLLGMLGAWLVRVPVRIYHLHGLPMQTATGLKRTLLRWAEKLACRLAHQVLCVSRSLQEVAVAERLCPADKIKVLLHGSINGVDADRVFNPARLGAALRVAVRARHGIPPGALVIGFVGRVVRDKGMSELAEAWTQLREEFPTLHLLIVGPFEPQDPVSADVEHLLRHDPRVHLAGLCLDVAPLYAAMDVVALPTYREGFGVVAIEAGAMELPVVATRIPGCVDAVADGVTGTLVPVRDGTALAEALRTYLRDEELRREHGQAGRRRVLRDFRQDAMWESVFAEYVRLLHAKGLPQVACVSRNVNRAGPRPAAKRKTRGQPLLVRALVLLLLVIVPCGGSPAQPPAQSAPRVAIAVPTTASTVSGPVRVTGDIVHDRPLVKTELLVNGVVVASSTKGGDFSLGWDAAKASRGKHTLTVRASDADGRTASASVQVQVRATFNVKSHGAKGDGKADDTKAIQSALTAARKAGGGSVYLPKGTYLVYPRTASVFAVGSNLEIRGEGPASVLKIGKDAGDYNYIFGQLNAEFDFPFVENVSFRDFRVDQNPAGNQTADIREDSGIQNAIQLHTFRNVTVQGVYFDPEPGIQAIVLDTQKADGGGMVIDGCFFRFVRGRSTLAHKHDHSSVYTETRNVLVRNNVFQAESSQCAITAIEVHGGPDVRIQGNRTEGFAAGVIVVNATPQYRDVPEGRFLVCNNRFLQTTQGIALWSNRGRTLRGVVVRDNEVVMGLHQLYTDVWLGVYLYRNDKDAATNGDFEKIEIARNRISFEKLKTGSVNAVGIDLAPASRAKDVVVQGNTILAAPARGIHLGHAATRGTLQDVRVEANTIVDAGWDTNVAAAARAAIVLDKIALTNVQINRNMIRDTGKPGAPRGRYAILAHPAAASKGVTLRQNQVMPSGALRDDIDRTRVVLQGTAP